MHQRLTLQNLQAHLGNERKALRINSDVAMPAQSNKLLHCSDLDDSAEFNRILNIIKDNNISIVLRAVLELQFLHGLRISETLNIGPGDITKNGRIRIKGLKGSHDRFVLSSSLTDFWTDTGVHLLPIGRCYSRFYFYREYKKLGIGAHFGNSLNKSVTHYFRHAVALDSQEQYKSLTDTKMVLGHKSLKSTEKYVKKRKL